MSVTLHTLRACVLAELLFCGWAAANLDGSACSADAGCSADYNSMIQSRVLPTKRSEDTLSHYLWEHDIGGGATISAATPAEVPAPREKDAMHEPDTAPRWWVSCLIFFGFASGILFLMVLLLGLCQLLVNWQKRLQEKFLANLDAEAAKEAATKTKLVRQDTHVVKDIDAKELAELVNGDHNRLDLLLSIGNAPNPTNVVKQLVQNAAKASKMRLSQESITQTCNGLTTVVKAAKKIHDAPKDKPKDPNKAAKEKLQKAFRKVLMMVKVSRALGIPIQKNQQELDITSHDDHVEHHADKYADGHNETKHQDVRLISRSSLQSYLSSEAFVDHTAIALVFFYSQVCALVYAIYLKQRFPKMYEFMGPWLLVSRGEAMAVIVLTCLMVLLLTRGFTTAIRRYVSWSTVLQTMADKHVLIHRHIGAMLVICAVLHIIGHIRGSIPAIIGETDSSKVEQAFTYGTKMKFNFNTWGGALRCWPAVTGILLVLILCAFWALSNERVRRYSFELFHYPHVLLIFLWSFMLIAHGWQQWLGVGVPLALISVFPVVCLYGLERVIHIIRGHSEHIKISHAVVKKRQVLLEIDTGKSDFKYSTGMYCMLNVPEISHGQWHPFTIASGGGQEKFQVLFAIVGDWTTQLSEMIVNAQKPGGAYPKICVRGGYGAPAEGMKDKKHIILVGGGVGATPFLSFLSNICNSAKAGVKDQFDGVESAVFYWVSREPDDFVWVNQYNTTIAETPSLKDRISIRLCLTKSLDTQKTEDCSAAEIGLFWLGVQIALRAGNSSKELASELGAPSQFGRPNWNKEFGTHVQELKKKHDSSTDKDEPLEVSVFACGNQMLVNSLEEACTATTDAKVQVRLFAEEF